ncbi:MAG: NDP-sugar synthase [Chloroflexota bacterium]
MDVIEQAVIIAAGRGVQLGPLTRDRPRPMLPVLGKPVVIRIMDRMREAGIRHFIVVVGEHEGGVASYLNGGWVPDAQVQIVLQPESRGTLDAFAAATRYITGPFLVASCDHLVPEDHVAKLIDQFWKTQADMILSLTPYSNETAFPVVTLDGEAVTEISLEVPSEDRRLSSFMVYACGSRILDHLAAASPDDYEMARPIQSLIDAGGQVGYLNAGWHMHLTKAIDLLTINKRFLREGRDTHILSEIPASVQIIPPVRIDPRVSVGRGAKIGPYVYLESGSQIGQQAIIRDSIVLDKSEIAPKEFVYGQIVMRRQRISEEPEAQKTRPTKPEGLQKFLDSIKDES